MNWRRTKNAPGCVFCAIVVGRAPAEVHERTARAILITPLNPVTPGHLLAIPTTHVARFHENPKVTARTMRQAAEWCMDEPHYNVIVNNGSAAGQTIFHLHVHLVPRSAQDGLVMPWDYKRMQEQKSDLHPDQ